MQKKKRFDILDVFFIPLFITLVILGVYQIYSGMFEGRETYFIPKVGIGGGPATIVPTPSLTPTITPSPTIFILP